MGTEPEFKKLRPPLIEQTANKKTGKPEYIWMSFLDNGIRMRPDRGFVGPFATYDEAINEAMADIHGER